MEKLICLYGPDGSGKTSIADLAASVIMKKVKGKVKKSWVRGSHLYVSLLARLLSHTSLFRGEDNPYYKISIPPKLRKIWLVLEYTSFIIVFIGRIIIPRLLGFIVIAERSIVDFMVWILLTLKDPRLLNTICMKSIISLALKYKCIYVTADPHILVSRRADELNLYKAIYQKIIYDYFADLLGSPEVDTGRHDITTTVDHVLNYFLSSE